MLREANQSPLGLSGKNMHTKSGNSENRMRKLKQMMTLQITTSLAPGFFVNKKVVEEDITPPTPRDMLHLSDDVLSTMEAVQLTSSDRKEIQLSKLQAFATKVTCIDDIDMPYL